MADTTTANIGLLIADLNDTYNFGAHVENNLTTIDSLMGLVKCTSATRPSNTYGGQGIYETDTLRVAVNTGTKASPTWTYVSSGVLVYTSSTRPATNLFAGMLIYESDTDALVRYTGSAWRYATIVKCTSSSRPTTGIAAGTTIYETDTTRLLVYNGTSWEQKAFGQYVCTSSTHPSSPFQGMEIYETDTGASAVYSGSTYLYGAQQIGTVKLAASAASISIAVPAGYSHLIGVYTGRQDSGSGGAFCFVRINGDAGTDYTWQGVYGNVSTASSSNAGAAVSGIRLGVLPGSGDTANYFGTGSFSLGNVSSSVFKPLSGHFQGPISPTNGYAGTYGGLWLSTSAITSVAIFPFTGNLVAGSSFTLYGIM